MSLNFVAAKRFYEEKGRFYEECEKVGEYLTELDPSHPKAATLSAHRKSELENRVIRLVEAQLRKSAPLSLSQEIEALQKALKESSGSLKAIKKLPLPLQKKIRHAVWVASGCPKDDPTGTKALESDIAILKRTFPGFYGPKEGTLLEQVFNEIKEELELACLKGHEHAARSKQRDDEKVAVFEGHLKNLKMNHRQMKALFRAMPESVQKRLKQQPPFYGRGFNPEFYKTLGAHYNSSTKKTTFRVYAPNARAITLHLTAYGRVEHAISLEKVEGGIWAIETPHAHPGRSYHFMIVGKQGGAPYKKVDPFAFGNLIHPSVPGKENHESVVVDIAKDFPWSDGTWLESRKKFNPAAEPMAIYEVHVPTWKKKKNGDPLNFRELAYELGDYCKHMGYSHVELMALFAHPQPISMGYQITGYFSLNSECGSMEDFQYFVNYMHQKGIGVIADWVPAHFALDKFALASFDGTPLFEDDDPQFAGNQEWGTFEFDFKKQYTREFLGSNLHYLFQQFHFDGMRVDAVESMLKLARPAGNRLNRKGGGDNLDAKAFFRNLTSHVRKNFPGTLMIAEEAMGYPNLTRPPEEKGTRFKTRGIGFDMTWHMGFKDDVLKYMALPVEMKQAQFSAIVSSVKKVDYHDDFRTRGKVVIPFSHDENANGKGTIFSQMGGKSFPEKFANGRLALAYQLLRGGGPVLDFMGNELLQTEEWHGRLIRSSSNPAERSTTSVQWEELDPKIDRFNYQFHRGARESRRDLLHLYRKSPGLRDQTDAGFSWIDANDTQNSVLSLHRRGKGQQFACVFNFSENDLSDYRIPLPDRTYAPELARLAKVTEVYNTDNAAYAGEGRLNSHIEILRDASGQPTELKLRLPPYSALVLEEHFS